MLVLWLAAPAIDTRVVAWSVWDGSSHTNRQAGDEDAPPYATGLEALRDGWRLIQMSSLAPHYPGTETQTSYLKYEFVFEQLVAAS